MDKRTYFLLALKEGLYNDASWVFKAFSKTKPEAQSNRVGKYLELSYTEEGFHYYDDGAWLPLETQGDILFSAKDAITISKDDVLLRLDSDTVDTTYGRVLANYVMIYFPFKSKLPFLNDRFSVSAILDSIARLLHDDPEDDDFKDDIIYVSDYLRFTQACMYWLNFTQLFIPGDTERSLVTHPDMVKFKEELMNSPKYKGKLHDQAILAQFEAELEALDREWLEGDDSLGLYVSAKDHKVVRKKLHRMLGHEAGFSDSVEANPIMSSLYEGWDLSRFADYNDSLRAGTFDRGSQTSKGGELVKWLLRASGTVNIIATDCKTKLGMRTTLTEEIANRYIGFNYVTDKGYEQITDSNVKDLINKELIIRSFMYCSLPGTDRCEVCAGARLAENPTGTSSAVTSMGDIIMNSFMKSMHGTVLSTATYDPAKILS